MTPTPEQVASWAREAGSFADLEWHISGGSWQHLRDERFAALVDAHRAEQDAKLCDKRKAEITARAADTEDDLAATMMRQIAQLGCGDDAAAIRASVKGNT